VSSPTELNSTQAWGGLRRGSGEYLESSIWWVINIILKFKNIETVSKP
jgi:hypothetical protein